MKLSPRLQQFILDTQTLPQTGAPTYQKVLALVYQLLGRKLIAKLMITSNRCNHCNVCAKVCPNHAIKFWFKNPRRSRHCKGCLWCVYSCPQRAFELPISRLLVAFLLIFLPFGEWIITIFSLNFIGKMPYAGRELFTFLLWCVGYTISAYIMGKIEFLLTTLPIVKRIGAFPSIQNLRNQIHPGLIFPIYLPK